MKQDPTVTDPITAALAPEVVEAAAEAISAARNDPNKWRNDDLARAALTVAAPLIAAAERRRLAEVGALTDGVVHAAALSSGTFDREARAAIESALPAIAAAVARQLGGELAEARLAIERLRAGLEHLRAGTYGRSTLAPLPIGGWQDAYIRHLLNGGDPNGDFRR